MTAELTPAEVTRWEHRFRAQRSPALWDLALERMERTGGHRWGLAPWTALGAHANGSGGAHLLQQPGRRFGAIGSSGCRQTVNAAEIGVSV